MIAAPTLAFGARQRVLLVGFGMQEHGEIAANRPKPTCEHLLWSRSDDDIIAVDHRSAEQLVAYRTADSVDFHAGGVVEAVTSWFDRFVTANSPLPSLPPGLGGKVWMAGRFVARGR